MTVLIWCYKNEVEFLFFSKLKLAGSTTRGVAMLARWVSLWIHWFLPTDQR